MFQRITLRHSTIGELARLADRYKAKSEPLSDRCHEIKPRDSTPTIIVGRSGATRSAKSWIESRNAVASASSGVMSLNRIPGFGKSGTSRM